MQSSGRLHLSEVNQHLVCVLCGGYFIDATTIVECLHSFCRSCLIKYLETNSFCPICDVQIHKAKPFLNIKPDKALQDIVYKLVPGLFHSEMRRRRDFYAKHPERMYETTPEGRGVGVERLIYSPDDSISLSLEYLDGDEDDVGCTSSHSSESGERDNGVNKRYLQCPALVTIGHLKKFLRVKYELTPNHSVEVIHRRESLPDSYTLMDVAYIYTWKRNGPMRFFFRIIQSPPEVSPVLQSAPSINNGPSSTEVSSQVSSTQSSSQSETTVSNPTQLPSSNSVPSKPAPKVETPKPTPKVDTRKTEVPRNVSVGAPLPKSAETVAVDSSETTKVSLPSTSTPQSTPPVVTKSTQSVSVSVTMTAVSSSPSTCAVSTTHSNQTSSTKENSKPVTKPPSHTQPIAVTKTVASTKTTASLVSSTSNVPVQVSETNKTVAPSVVTDTKAYVQQPSPKAESTAKVFPHKSVQHTTAKPPLKQSLPNAEQPIPKSASKENTQSSMSTKIPMSQQFKENSQKAHSQVSHPALGGNGSAQKPSPISNGVSNDEKKSSPTISSTETKTSLSQSQPERPIIAIKTESEETASSSSNIKVLTEDTEKSTSLANSTPSGTLNTPKAALMKQVQQRLLNSARKPSMPIKCVSETNSTKGPQNSLRQSQPTKDTARLPRVNQKATEKLVVSSDSIASKKENAPVKSNIIDKNESVKESSSISTNSTDKDTLNSAGTLQTSVNNTNSNNNNVKVPPHNQQIIRNNQQILKKNDEIMRCVTSIKRPIQPLPRKTADVLKNCSASHRTSDDKSNVKKRRITITNPIKRPLVNTSDASKPDEPAAKRAKPALESNRKLPAFDQKAAQMKVRSANVLPGQSLVYTTVKTEPTAEVSSNAAKSCGNNTPIHVTASEHKNNTIKVQESDKKNGVKEKVAPIAVHRTQLNCQPTVASKLSLNSMSPSTIKTEPSASKTDIPSPVRRSPASTQSGQNMTSPPIPIVAHSNMNSRLCPTPLPPNIKGKQGGADSDGAGALDLSASPRRQHQQSILSIAQTLARRQQQQCPSPAPPPLSPLSSLSPFPVMPSVPVRSPPPQLRIPVPPLHRTGHAQQQQRPSSLSSSSPSPPADTLPGSSRMGPPPQQQQQQEMYSSHIMTPAALMFRQQIELQRLWSTNKHNATPHGMEWFNDANSIKRFENLMKSLQQQQQQQQGPGRNPAFYPFNNNNTAAAANNHRK